MNLQSTTSKEKQIQGLKKDREQRELSCNGPRGEGPNKLC